MLRVAGNPSLKAGVKWAVAGSIKNVHPLKAIVSCAVTSLNKKRA
jgi:hypothetical protein